MEVASRGFMPESVKIDAFNEGRGNLIVEKSFVFAARTVSLVKRLQETRREYTLSRQLLKSSTSIGANIEEALGGYSKADFAAKMAISYKEARETSYWLRLMVVGDYLTEAEAKPLLADVNEIIRILAAILIATKPRIR
jgi:four helix bundle protein